jgi:phosphoglycerol geranylgeranyltransferase
LVEVEQHLNRIIENDGAAHITLIDPGSQSPNQAAIIAQAAMDGGTDVILLGGSIGADALLNQTILEIKKVIDIPTILFPSGAGGVSPHADAIFFMSLLNSRNVEYITTNQAMGAPLVHKYGIEPIPMAYLIVEPGGTVGWVGDAKLIPQNKPDIAAAYALAGKYLGMRYTYLETGSGVDAPANPKMIQTVKQILGENKLIVGGGIRNGTIARTCVEAGADIIVTGTVIEKSNKVTSKIEELVSAIKR